MLKRMTVDNHIPAMLFSLEMNECQIANRLLSCVCEIPCEKLKKGLLAPYEWGQLDYKIKELNDTPLYIDTAAALTIEELCQKAQNAIKEYGVGLIVIDYLQLLYQKIAYSESRYTELNYFTRRLKSLAKELNIPIIITSQLNRETERRGGLNGGRPQLSDYVTAVPSVTIVTWSASSIVRNIITSIRMSRDTTCMESLSSR